MTDTTHKWIWMMNYCKRNGLPPAQAWAWERAEAAFMDEWEMDMQRREEAEDDEMLSRYEDEVK